jgi:predicted lipoprotein with Yx(FWY)xxD motif
MPGSVRIAGFVLAVCIVAAGCGDSPYAGASTGDARAGTTAPGSSTAPTRSGSLVKVVSSRYGRVVADSKGEALYLFTKDGRGRSQCYGACAQAWPPFLTKAKPRAGKGIQASGLGTRKRSDGKLQVTYKGQALYYYVADKPGLILCQDVFEYGGDWLVVAPSGKAVR